MLRALALLVALLGAGCNTRGEGPLQFDHYLGDVFLEPGVVPRVEHRFVFTNHAADRTAKLELRSTTCGCSEVTIERPRVPPGEQSGLHLRIRPNYAPEYRTESARIATGLDELPFFIVTLSASVYPRLELRADLQRRHTVEWGGTRSSPVTAVAWQPRHERPGTFTATLEWGVASLRPDGAQREDLLRGVRRMERRWRLVLPSNIEQAQQSAHEGYRDRLIVRYAGRELKQEVKWVEEPLIRAEPPRLFLAANVDSMKEAKLRLVGNTPFAIVGLEHPATLAVDGMDKGQAAEHVLRLRLVRSAGTRRATLGTLVVTTDHKFQRRVVVPVCVLHHL